MWSTAWPSLVIVNHRKTLSAVEVLVQKPASDQADEVGNALSRFLVVRACGYLEAVTEECCGAYTESKSSPKVALYARSWLGKGRNPWPSALIELVQRFDQDWASELSGFLAEDDDYRKRELSSMVDKRNRIAHGAGEGVTATKALTLTKVAVEVAQWFVTRFDPR
ncbi:HEPN domain-containing protein [Amycolatopsis sp. NPDC051371]|uniref:HEPN domain-containing protein n=1 Tax=Amycolatopsis sp. NPDC051371 TaxID=3155800 RepID=UPI003420A8F7